MRTLLLILFLCLAWGCRTPTPENTVVEAGPTPVPTASIPADGDYPARGVITQVNQETGVVEINHEDIKDMMPAMKMMFNTKDKSVLEGFKAGDHVEFVLEYKHPTEIVTSIRKIP